MTELGYSVPSHGFRLTIYFIRLHRRYQSEVSEYFSCNILMLSAKPCPRLLGARGV